MRAARRLLACGERAILVELAGLDEVLALAAAVRAAVAAGSAGFAGVSDVVPAATTVLVVVADGADLAPLRTALATLEVAPDEGLGAGDGGSRLDDAGAETVEIVVRYDGPDLDEVAERTGLTRAAVVSAHTATPWRVAFGGFAPGFAYLAGGDPRLRVPRRSEPRTSVPAGAVALAGEYSAVYPRASPGGWQVIGQTAVTLWDVERDPPALLRPGMRVRFRDAAGGP